jgi:predicted tellurium resistance membrane protein TerC
MIDQLLTGEAFASFLTLSALEIVLGIDNIIFLAIITSRLPKGQQNLARKIGLGLALLGRITFLTSVTWMMKAQDPVLDFGEYELSARDIILILGGLFLVYKSVVEIHSTVEGIEDHLKNVKNLSFMSAIIQIGILDVVFALDSMITAVGLSDFLTIMIAANVVAMIVMLVASEPVSDFIEEHPSLKMLALSFLLMVGVALVADGFHFHIPRNYIYFSLAFSSATEFLNIFAKKRQAKKRKKK